MDTLLLATTNTGKIAELRNLLMKDARMGDLVLVTPYDLPTVLGEVTEDGETFAENARLKARAYAGSSGFAALADDSGLCVDALDGQPGIHSARWAGPADADRCEALLKQMESVPLLLRTAHFLCAVCVAFPDGRLVEAEGRCEGVIAMQASGQGGFGYDCLFLPSETHLTFAELSPEHKSFYSHRALAVSNLIPKFVCLLGTLSHKTK